MSSEVGQAFLASAELGQWAVLEQAVLEWRNTTIVHADAESARVEG